MKPDVVAVNKRILASSMKQSQVEEIYENETMKNYLVELSGCAEKFHKKEIRSVEECIIKSACKPERLAFLDCKI